jgi:hypothetical protein
VPSSEIGKFLIQSGDAFWLVSDAAVSGDRWAVAGLEVVTGRWLVWVDSLDAFAGDVRAVAAKLAEVVDQVQGAGRGVTPIHDIAGSPAP